MTLDHLSKFFKGSKPLPSECSLPVLKEASRPPFALIAPQLAKGLFEQVSGVEPLVGAEQSLQSLAAFQSQIVPTRQQRVLLPLDKAAVFATKPAIFALSHLIERLTQMAQHMKLVVKNSRMGSASSGSVAEWFPHVLSSQRLAYDCSSALASLRSRAGGFFACACLFAPSV